MRERKDAVIPRPAQQASSSPTFSPSFLGISFILIWNQCVLYAQRVQVDDGINTIAISLARCLCIMALAFIAMRPALKTRGGWFPRWWEIVSVSLMTVGSLLLMLARVAGISGAAIPAIICCGVGATWGSGVWIRFWLRLPIRPAFTYALASMVIASVVGIGICFLPTSASLTIAILMPMASYVAYLQSMARLDSWEKEAKVNSSADAPKTSLADSHRAAASAATAVPMTSVRIPMYDSEPRSTLWRLLIGIALFSFVLGVSRGFPNGVSIELPPIQRVMQYVLVATVIALACLSLRIGRRPRVAVAWQTLIAMMFFGVVLLAIPGSEARGWGAMLISAVNLLQVSLLWLLAYDSARFTSKVPPCVVLGFYWLAHLLFRELGRFMVLVAGPHVTQEQSVLVAGLVFLLAIVMGFLLTDRIPRTRPFFDDFVGGAAASSVATQNVAADQDSNAVAASASVDNERPRSRADMGLEGHRPVNDDDAMPSKAARVTDTASSTDANAVNAANPANATSSLDWMRDEFSLTNREFDVACLLAQGRSSTYIANELVLSPQTVRGYIKSIYAKTGAHSKQQFIDMALNK